MAQPEKLQFYKMSELADNSIKLLIPKITFESTTEKSTWELRKYYFANFKKRGIKCVLSKFI